MHVVFLINSLHGGGAENVVHRLSHTLASMEHHIYLFLLYDDIDYIINDNSIKVNTLEGKNHQEKAVNFDKKLDEIENKIGKIDAIYSFLQGAHSVAYHSMRSDNIYMSIRNYESKKLKEKSYLNYLIKIFKFRKLYNNKKLLTVCDAVQNDLKTNLFIKPKSMQTIYNPYEFDQLKHLANEKLEDTIHKKYILLVGSFNNTQKRQDIAIKIMHMIDKEFDLIFLGKGKMIHQYKDLAKKLHVSERVHFKEWTPNPYPWIKKASVVLITSDYEGFPNVLVESLIIGTPVVCRQSFSGIDEILTGEWNRYIIKDDKNYRSLAKMVNHVAKNNYSIDKKLYHSFSSEIIAKQYLKTIERN